MHGTNAKGSKLTRHAVCDLQHERSDQVADKAQGEAKCFSDSCAVNCVLHNQAHTLNCLL